MDDENFTIITNPEIAKEVSMQAETDFVTALHHRGFDLLAKTAKRWWPLNY